MLPLPWSTGSAVWYPAWDESIFRMLNLAGTNAVLDLLMVLFSALALPYILGLLVVPLWWKGERDRAFDLLVLLVVVIVVTQALKYAFDRARPCDAGVLPGVHLLTPGACAAEGDPAFPSGHTSRIFGVAAFLAVYFRRPSIRISGFVLALLAGISRVYLGVHWPSDVIGGAALGIGVALAFIWVSRKWALYGRIRAAVVAAVSRVLPKRAPPA